MAYPLLQGKLALLTAENVSATAVHVDTNKGVVVLHGKVKTDEEKGKAEAVVRGIEGVRTVRNMLEVVPDAFREAVKAGTRRSRGTSRRL